MRHGIAEALHKQLSASEARCRELEDQLCRAREWMILAKTLNGTECGYHDNRRRKRGMERCGKCLYCVIDYAITVHLSALPCSHADRCTDLEKEVNAQRVIDMSPPRDQIWTDEHGKDYTLRWDKGDPSVGINAHWECDELDALQSYLSASEIKVRELENKLSAAEARVAMLEKAQFRETPMVLDPNGDGQSYVTLGEYMDSAALDALKEGK